MNNKSKKNDQPLEGEGSYNATRRYNQHLAEALASGDLEQGADEASRAMASPEGEELEWAAERAKKGPKPKTEGAPKGKATARK